MVSLDQWNKQPCETWKPLVWLLLKWGLVYEFPEIILFFKLIPLEKEKVLSDCLCCVLSFWAVLYEVNIVFITELKIKRSRVYKQWLFWFVAVSRYTSVQCLHSAGCSACGWLAASRPPTSVDCKAVPFFSPNQRTTHGRWLAPTRSSLVGREKRDCFAIYHQCGPGSIPGWVSPSRARGLGTSATQSLLCPRKRAWNWSQTPNFFFVVVPYVLVHI